MTEDFSSVVSMLRPFADKAKEAGFDVEIKVRSTGATSTHDRVKYSTGYYSEKSQRDDPMCPDDREEPRARDVRLHGTSHQIENVFSHLTQEGVPYDDIGDPDT